MHRLQAEYGNGQIKNIGHGNTHTNGISEAAWGGMSA